jgi:hypothetical protein
MLLQANASTIQVQAVAQHMLDSTFAHLKDMATVLAQATMRQRSSSSSIGEAAPAAPQQPTRAGMHADRSLSTSLIPQQQLQQQPSREVSGGSCRAEVLGSSVRSASTASAGTEPGQKELPYASETHLQQQLEAGAEAVYDLGELYTTGLNEVWSNEAQALPPEFQLSRNAFSAHGVREPLLPESVTPHFQAMLQAEQGAAAAAAAGAHSVSRSSAGAGALAAAAAAASGAASGDASGSIDEEESLVGGEGSIAGSSAGDVAEVEEALELQQQQQSVTASASVVAEDSMAAGLGAEGSSASVPQQQWRQQQQQQQWQWQHPQTAAAAVADEASSVAEDAFEDVNEGRHYAGDSSSSQQYSRSDFESDSCSQQPRQQQSQRSLAKRRQLLQQQQQQDVAGAVVCAEELQQQVGIADRLAGCHLRIPSPLACHSTCLATLQSPALQKAPHAHPARACLLALACLTPLPSPVPLLARSKHPPLPNSPALPHPLPCLTPLPNPPA